VWDKVRTTHLEAGLVSTTIIVYPVDGYPHHQSTPTASDHLRRARLLWTIFCHDVVRSATLGQMYRIHDEEVGRPMKIDFYDQPVVSLASPAH
jgi:hypothetical protein